VVSKWYRSVFRSRLQLSALAAMTAVGVAAAAFASSSVAGPGRAGSASATIPSWAKVFGKYVGVKKFGPANPKLSPVTIGWVNAQGGVVQAPEATVALNTALKVINTYLGGVGGGHPLKAKKCFVVQQESEGQKCAQQFANDPKIPLVLQGNLPIGATGFHNTMAGKKPVVGFNPITVAEATAKNMYDVAAGLFGTQGGFLTYLVDIIHAKNVSWLYPGDDPAAVTGLQVFKAAAEKAGVKVTAAGFTFSSTDLLAAFAAANAQSSDATVLIGPAPNLCIAGSKAADQLKVKNMLSLSLCLTPPVQQALGDYPKWTYIALNESGDLPKADPYVAAWRTAMGALVKNFPTVYGPYGQLTFGTTLTAAKLINQIGAAKLTPATFAAKIKKFHGQSMFGPPHLNFGSVPGLPALGSTAVRFYNYLGNGKWSDATGGKWVGG
jgi:branched-chain amino acid transport system substrate-binding protein